MKVYGEYNFKDPNAGSGFDGWTGRFVTAKDHKAAVAKLPNHDMKGLREMDLMTAMHEVQVMQQQVKILNDQSMALLRAVESFRLTL